MTLILRLSCVFALAVVTVQAQSGTESRRQLLDDLLRMLHPSRAPANGRINVHDRTWEDWLKRTGEPGRIRYGPGRATGEAAPSPGRQP